MRKFVISLLCVTPLLVSVPSQGWSSEHAKKDHQITTKKRGKHERYHRGPRGPKGETGAKGDRGEQGSPAIVAYGQVETKVAPGKGNLIEITTPGAVPMNQPAHTSSNVLYDATSCTFTVKEAGTYMISYSLQAQYGQAKYDCLAQPDVNGILSVAVEINGQKDGEFQLYPIDVRFDQYSVPLGSGSQRLLRELPANSTVRLIMPSVPVVKEPLFDNDGKELTPETKYISLTAKGDGVDTAAFLSLVKIG